ncbi:HNH endonuclease signature motif containing protein [Gordonia sp. CPCC 205515]|uniref:HNH endonuclease signature motif containing protein n=1 Tax=Gordonia sp. CPCC 205515 TaxID=3140791 RepID=UPI003AF3A6C3
MLTTQDLHPLATELTAMPPADTESDAIDRLTLLETIKAAATAAQARDTARLDELRCADEEQRKVPKSRRGRGLAAEVGLARKASPQKGAQYLGFARALVHEMPHTRSRLATGELTEWRATILVRETAYLTRESREEIDRRMCADTDTLDGMSDRQVEATAKAHAYELEPRAVVARGAKATKDRRVSTRPAPDLMTSVTALLPMAQGISVYAALKQHADSIVGGDERTRDQIMADTLVERVTGQATAEAVPVAVDVVISVSALLGGSEEPAHVPGHGTIPAQIAREMIAAGLVDEAEAHSTLRRLFARPADGALVSMESAARAFPKSLAHFITVRDRYCRTPYCGATIAEIDHARPHHDGGETSARNADGTCRIHNRAKEMSGWHYRTVDTRTGHLLETITPTGHAHRSSAPAVVGHHPATVSRVENRLLALLNAA